MLYLLLIVAALQAPEDKVVGEGVKFLKSAPAGERAAAARLLDRWFPDRASLMPYLAEGGALGAESKKFFAKHAAFLAAFAASELDRKRPVSAGMEAFRALGLDPSCEKAAMVLAYVNLRHPREAELRGGGLEKTEWGWIPAKLAKSRRDGLVPDGGKWVEEKDADAAHGEWERPHELKFTLVTVRSSLPIASAAALGRRIDWFLEWLRARFCGVDGYGEPQWPISLYVPGKDEDYTSMLTLLAPGGSPYGICFYPTKPFVLVNGPNCRDKSVEGTEGIAQHEVSHAFFALAFHGNDPMPGTPYGWMVEAFPAYCYYVSPERPIDGDFWKRFRQKYADAERKKEVDRITKGEDVLGRLNKLDFEKAKGDLQAYLAGGVLTMYAMSTPEVREKYGRFVADFFLYRVDRGDFERYLGPSAELSRKIAEWLARRPSE